MMMIIITIIIITIIIIDNCVALYEVLWFVIHLYFKFIIHSCFIWWWQNNIKSLKSTQWWLALKRSHRVSSWYPYCRPQNSKNSIFLLTSSTYILRLFLPTLKYLFCQSRLHLNMNKETKQQDNSFGEMVLYLKWYNLLIIFFFK